MPREARDERLDTRTARLFEVVEGVYQARGYDLSVMSIIKSDHGYIVVDPFVLGECASAVWQHLVIQNLETSRW